MMNDIYILRLVIGWKSCVARSQPSVVACLLVAKSSIRKKQQANV